MDVYSSPLDATAAARMERWAALGPALVAVALGVAHLATVSHYGIFRDEFYYLACGRRLAWGYVDHPPLVAVLARVSTTLFGQSAPAIRIVPIACALLTICVADAIARRLGGGAFARLITALCIAIAPHFLFVFHILSMNAPEILLWTLGVYALIVAVEDRRPAAWLAFGLICGVGLLNKHSMLVFGAGIGAGLLATRARRTLLTPWPWVAGLVAAVLFAPHVVWQAQHGWPTAEFIANAQREKIAAVSPLGFVGAVTLMLNPFTAPVWLAGIVAAFRGKWVWNESHPSQATKFIPTPFSPAAFPPAAIGWCFLVTLAVFITQQSKPYYLTPIFPAVFAAGAVAIERWTSRARRARVAIPAVLLSGGLASAPMALPVFSVDRFIAYYSYFGAPPSGERHELGVLPQHFADMFGWEDLARTVSRVYLALPEGERATARVFAQNYGEAGALEYYASRYPLPRVISPHNSYWYWGPGPDGGTIIIVGGDVHDHQRALEQVVQVTTTTCTYCMPYERGLPVYVGRGWKVSLAAIWPREKRFI